MTSGILLNCMLQQTTIKQLEAVPVFRSFGHLVLDIYLALGF